MILVLGGTTEGRKAVATLDKAGKPYVYSTRSDLQEVESPHAIRVNGALDEQQMAKLCTEHGIKAMVDAAHPFATRLHATVAACSRLLSIPVVRYERTYPHYADGIVWCDDYADAVDKMMSDSVQCLLALTGVQTIVHLRDFWTRRDCYFRILNRDESLDKACEAGFPRNRLLYYENDVDITNIVSQIHPDAIITKESGESGGFGTKVSEALACGLRVYAIRRPKLPDGFVTVTGEYGLRKAIESLVPGYYELRSGFTTGACATAAAKAALIALVSGEKPDTVTFEIPDGEEMSMDIAGVDIASHDTAAATVVKDAGDDPDVTDGCMVKARVRLAEHGDVRFYGGEGVGTVTLPGLGLEIGEPAINPVPRLMMRTELLRLYPQGCDVTISVPGGEALARRTFNERVGIQGGLSIIGTSGVVMPYSNEAFMEAISREMEVAKAMGCDRVVLNSGAKSEKAVKGKYPELPSAAFIHYGNAIGESLVMADSMGIERVTVGVMIGKAVKLAEGNTDTHSHKVTVNKEFLAGMAKEAACSEAGIESIRRVSMARELWTILSPCDSEKFFPRLLHHCKEVCRQCFHGNLTMMLINDGGEIAEIL